jgi:hypothetical protein
VAGNATRLGAVLQLAGMAQPAASDMLDKSAIDFPWRSASLTPVKHELCPNRIRKSRINSRLSQYIEGVLTRDPVLAKRRRRADFEAIVLCLPIAPLRQCMLPELRFHLFCGVGYEAFPDFLNKYLGHTVVECEQIN